MAETQNPAAGEAPETDEVILDQADSAAPNATANVESGSDERPTANAESGSREAHESAPFDPSRDREGAEDSAEPLADARGSVTPESANAESWSDEHPTADEESGSDSGEAVQLEMDADVLLGETEQPPAAGDAQALELKAVLEAVVYVMNEPMPAAQIAEALGRDKKEVEAALRELVEETSQPGRGLFIREVAGGYQMATKPEHHESIRTFVKNLKQPLKLSQAALETLAVIAYKQPITLPEILEIRGVQGGGVLKTLIDRKLVTTAGRKQVIGRPMLYKTTKDFLTQFGLKDVGELPSLKEFEEIRRQSMADEEFANDPAPPPASTANAGSGSPEEPESANEESGSSSQQSRDREGAEDSAEPLVDARGSITPESANEENGSPEEPESANAESGSSADPHEEVPNA